MSNNLRIPSPWSQLALFLGVFGGALFLYAVVINAINVSAGIMGEIKAGTEYIDPRAIGILKLDQALSSVIIFGIPAWVYARMTFRTGPLPELGIRPAVRSNFYILAVLLLLIALPLEFWLVEFNKHIPLPHWMNQLETDADQQVSTFLKVNNPFDAVINLLVMAALPAFFEELCFRGALQRILIHICRGPWAGILLSAALFSAFHMQFAGFLPRMFLGMLLGAAYWYSGSLWPSILAHFFFNGIQVSAAMFYPPAVAKDPSIPLYSVLISLVIVVGLLYRMKKLNNGIEPFRI